MSGKANVRKDYLFHIHAFLRPWWRFCIAFINWTCNVFSNIGLSSDGADLRFLQRASADVAAARTRSQCAAWCAFLPPPPAFAATKLYCLTTGAIGSPIRSGVEPASTCTQLRRVTPTGFHCSIPGSKLTFSTNLSHHSQLVPTRTAFSDYTGPDLLCSTVFHF